MGKLVYQQFLFKYILVEHVAPMEELWLQNVLQMVPRRLKHLSQSIEALSDEMREDYLLSVKKAIGNDHEHNK